MLVNFTDIVRSVLHNGLGQYQAAGAAAWRDFEHDHFGFGSLVVPELAEAAARNGDTAIARAALEYMTERTRVTPTEWALGTEALVRALLGEGETAERHYRESIRLLGRTPVRAQLARSHLLYGEWLRRENRRLDARAELRTAHDMLSAMGAEGFAERARRELLAAGDAVRKRTAGTVSELTEQEAHIARLAVDGRTNSEIGAQLFLSARTVEWHLRKVYTKLGVGSRRELGQALATARSAQLKISSAERNVVSLPRHALAADQGRGQGLSRVRPGPPACHRGRMAESHKKEHRVVIVGAGFAGFNAARELSRLAGATTEIVVINSTDYFLYLPLMPQVTGSLVEPSHIRVSLARRLRKTRFVLGTVNHVDARGKTVSWAGPEGSAGQVGYDRLILTAGSVNKLLPIPGITDYAVGFRSIAEATYLRDHIIRQLELASLATDPGERAARCTFVVVGAGYTGTEVTANGERLTTRLARTLPGLAGQEIRWMLLDLAPRVLAELDPRLSRTAERVLRRRGVQVLTGQSIAAALDGAVQLTTGDKVLTRSLIWCVGVRADPLVEGLDLATNRGRLVVDEYMAVPGTQDIWACGDCAAVPDLTRPGQVTGMTAQHAERQGKLVARNVAASLGHGTAQPYKHHDLGFLVDLGGLAAAANPLRIPLSGLPANVVTRAYHLGAMSGNRLRVATDWTLNGITSPELTSLALISAESVPLDVNQPRA
jgi:NADH:ubiquinone reductase (H+-translocating)